MVKWATGEVGHVAYILSSLSKRSSLYLSVFPGGSDGKESACNAGDLGSIPGSGRSPGGGHDNPLQYSILENPRGQRSLAGHSSWGRKQSDICDWVTKDSSGLSSTLISGTKLIGRRRQDNKKATQAKHSQTRALLTEVPVSPILESQMTNHFCSIKSWYFVVVLNYHHFFPRQL